MKEKRTKEVVHLSLRKLANGCSRYYLDYRVNGKRYREFLTNLTLRPAHNTKDRTYNKNVAIQADAIKNERQREIISGTFGTEQARQMRFRNARLLDVLELYRQEKERTGQSKSVAITVHNLMLHVEAYCGKEQLIKDVSVEFCNDFVSYLTKAKAFGTNKVVDKKKGTRKPLRKATATLYFDTLVCALNWAVDMGYLKNNPINKHTVSRKNIRPPKKSRGYLTTDEVFRLIDTPYRNEAVKRAFLFGCFCGLRISDVKRLKWNDIKKEEEIYKIDITMKKTEDNIMIPLNNYALQWLPERGKAKPNDLVFNLPANTTMNNDLKTWAKAANITKNVSFHISRHTFATLLLTSGTPITVISKLLGHKSLKTTLIYAEVIDNDKNEAVDNLANFMDRKKNNSDNSHNC